MIFRVRHTTHYGYQTHVSLCYNRAHLLPRNTHYQRCQESRITITPPPAHTHRRRDYFGNNAYHFAIQEAHRELVIDVVNKIEVDAMKLRRDLDLDIGNTCRQALAGLRAGGDETVLAAREFVLDSSMIKTGAALREYALPSFSPERTLLSATRELTHRIFTDFTYDPGFSTVATPLREVLEHRRGVCQDFAHLAIGCLRSLGYSARYISGYLETFPPPGQQKLIGSDASHAWFAVYSPGEGWFEFDPTNNNMPGAQHLTTAWGRDYSDVTPLQGVIFDGGHSQELKVSVDVQQVS